MQPLLIRNKQIGNGKNAYTTPVPCGKCPECVKARTQSWSFRIEKELERSHNPIFLTLTYNEDHVPTTKHGIKTLDKKHVQLWLKKLRKLQAKYSPISIKYFFVGEYGSKTNRPHYHAVLLNCLDPKFITQTWDQGYSYILPLKQGGIPYILKYLHKPKIKTHEDQQREFSLFSKGLGSNYLTTNMVNYHTSNLDNCYITLKGGITMALPKYYKEKLYNEDQRSKVTAILKNRAETKEDNTIKRLIKKHLTKSVKILLRNRELSKLHKKFDKRLHEVL